MDHTEFALDALQEHAKRLILPNQTPAAFIEAWILEEFRLPWQSIDSIERKVCT